MDYSSTAGPGRFIVPQQVFSPPSAVTPTFREPIRFSAQGNAGVNLRDVSTPSYSGLMNADQPVSLGANTIFICIHVRTPVVLMKHEMLIRTLPSCFPVAGLYSPAKIYSVGQNRRQANI